MTDESKGESKLETTHLDKDRSVVLTTAQRRAGLYTVFAMLVLLGYFLYLQITNSGFFTDEFKWPEMLALYIPILLSMAAPIQRFITGKADSATAIEAVADFSMAIGALILLVTFPFDFSHLADPLPANMQFLFSWITDTVGKVILVLQIVIGSLSGLAKTRDYYRMKRENSTA